MFVKDTQVFTDTGWKAIQDISGQDKVLVRNFIGDAELIQPFAVKRREYNGEVLTIGGQHWQFTVTPDTSIVYERDSSRKFFSVKASEISLTNHIRIQRKFKYMFSDEPKKEQIRIWDQFGSRTQVIPHEDWYTLVAYVLAKGFVDRTNRPTLIIFLNIEKLDEETRILGDIFDRMGLGWNVVLSKQPKLMVSSRNTLVTRLTTRLGSSTRKKMYLPDKMVYNSTKELTDLLINTFKNASGS